VEPKDLLPIFLLGNLIGFLVLYLVIRAAVYNALVQFLKAAAREGGPRGNHDVPARLDQVAIHLAEAGRSGDRA
jgi:hypothetical protein